nr:MAG TPA: hypothetical protein [Bacteriophage sp.]
MLGVILNSIQTSCPTEVSSRVSKCWLFVLGKEVEYGICITDKR